MVINFRILGIPMAKQSFKITRNGKKYTPSDIKREHENIRAQTIAQLGKGFIPLTCGIELSVFFTFPPPKSIRKKDFYKILAGKPVPKTTKPDMENLLKLLNDALQGVLFINDSQICNLHSYKRYGNVPGIAITCSPVEE